jgi:prophage DNA circulation protein
MSWRDRYLPASFRGVPFKVEAHELKFGRRVVVHEFPNVDGGESEDLGRKPGEFSIEAYVLGEDHDLQRSELLRVCEEIRGPGELVHPYLGTRTVVFLEGGLAERSSDARLSRISLTFKEVGERRLPARRADPLDAVRSSSSALQDAAEDELVGAMMVDGVPEYVRQAGADSVEKAVKAIEKLSVFGGKVARVAELRTHLKTLLNSVEDLTEDPRRLAEEIRFSLAAVELAALNREKGLDGYLELLRLLPTLHGGSTALDLQADANASAVTALVRRCALAGAVTLAAQNDWETRDDALQARDRLAEEIEIQAEESSSDPVYIALGELRSVLNGSVPPPDEDLPELRSISLSDSEPSLVVAYELYADATRGDEIVRRNSIRHPAFLPAATPLLVLQDAE